MKVLFAYQFATLGGVETVLHTRIDALEQRGVQADLLFLADYGGRAAFRQERVYLKGDPADQQALLADNRYDVVVVVDTPQLYPILANLSPRPAVVTEVHTTYPEQLVYLRQLRANDTQAIITPSRYLADFVRRSVRFPIPVAVVPNPLPSWFLNGPAESCPVPEKPTIGWVGRLDVHKNWPEALHVLRELRQTDVALWIVGGERATPDTKRSLWQHLVLDRLLTRVLWVPAVRYQRMPGLYSTLAASRGCFLSTSRNESFGMTVLEAMASGCPVVAPRVGGIPELVQHGVTGLLYTPGDVAEAAIAVRQLLQEAELRRQLAAQARLAVREKYDPTVVINSWVQTVEMLVDSPLRLGEIS